MRRALATYFNEAGNTAKDHNRHSLSVAFYRLAILLCPRWNSPWYNLGLQRKYKSEWRSSLRCNQRAAALDPADEASWWNMGIAATAVREWSEALRAWSHFGVSLSEEDGELRMAEVMACVRIDPKMRGEVVWGTRIDPARIKVRNVPLPESQRRYGDVLLNDGAQEGSRTREGREYQVFNELALWKASRFSTFRVALVVPNQEADDRLTELCDEFGFACEDWGTIRRLCTQCSLGNPGAHACVAEDEHGGRKFGFGGDLARRARWLLERRVESTPGAVFEEVKLVLMASAQA